MKKIIMLVNNVVTTSKEFFELNFEDLMEVMFLVYYPEGTAVIRFTNNQMPSLTKDTADAWREQFKLVSQLYKNTTLKGFGATASGLCEFCGVVKLFYNA